MNRCRRAALTLVQCGQHCQLTSFVAPAHINPCAGAQCQRASFVVSVLGAQSLRAFSPQRWCAFSRWCWRAFSRWCWRAFSHRRWLAFLRWRWRASFVSQAPSAVWHPSLSRRAAPARIFCCVITPHPRAFWRRRRCALHDARRRAVPVHTFRCVGARHAAPERTFVCVGLQGAAPACILPCVGAWISVPVLILLCISAAQGHAQRRCTSFVAPATMHAGVDIEESSFSCAC